MKAKKYWEKLCNIWVINSDSIIPFEEWYEMEGYELFE